MKRAMRISSQKHVTIIGAGLTGCFLALLLAKRGYKVDIFEKSSRKEITQTASKKSFNLTFYGYTISLLKKIGIWESVKQEAMLLKGSITQVGPHGKEVYFSFSTDAMKYFTIQRSQLLALFLNKMKNYSQITVHFETKIISIDKYEKLIYVEKNKKIFQYTYALLFGADGAYSEVRACIQNRQDTTHTLSFAPWSYKQIIFPQKIAAQLGLQKHTQYAWTRKDATIIAFPTTHNSFAALCMLPKNKNHNFTTLQTKESVYQFIQNTFPQLQAAKEIIAESFLQYPTGNFVTVQTDPWYYHTSIALVGDAAHALLPFYGIGMSIGFGDCLCLEKLMHIYHDNWEKILPLYQEQRKPQVDSIAAFCKESLTRFTRYKLGDYCAIYDKLEETLHTLFPQLILPPLFKLVVTDPDNVTILYKKYQRQRKVLRLLGIPIAIQILIKLLDLYETVFVFHKRTTSNS